ncbi:hypothetical protein ACFLQ0_06595, partial [Nitrospinota bacterium]
RRSFSFYGWMLSWSHVVNFLRMSVVDVVGPVGLFVPSKCGSRCSNKENIKVTKIYMDHLRRVIKISGSDFLVFYIPKPERLVEFRKSGKHSVDEKVIREILAIGNMELYSMAPVLGGSDNTINQLYYNEGHWTPVAHFLAAKFMADQIEKHIKNK